MAESIGEMEEADAMMELIGELSEVMEPGQIIDALRGMGEFTERELEEKLSFYPYIGEIEREFDGELKILEAYDIYCLYDNREMGRLETAWIYEGGTVREMTVRDGLGPVRVTTVYRNKRGEPKRVKVTEE